MWVVLSIAGDRAIRLQGSPHALCEHMRSGELTLSISTGLHGVPVLARAAHPGNGAGRAAERKMACPACCKPMCISSVQCRTQQDVEWSPSDHLTPMQAAIGGYGERHRRSAAVRQAAPWEGSRGCAAGCCAPEESRGEDEKGDSAFEDMDWGEMLPDMTGPSCTCAARAQPSSRAARPLWGSFALTSHDGLPRGMATPMQALGASGDGSEEHAEHLSPLSCALLGQTCTDRQESPTWQWCAPGAAMHTSIVSQMHWRYDIGE